MIRLCNTLSQYDNYKLYFADSLEEKYRETLKEAEQMRSTEGYLGREKDVQLPKYMGGGLTNVWYLMAKGVAAARVLDEYFVRFACVGMPCGTKKDRIPHELAVTESFLKLHIKQIICDFIPERELKSRLMKRRHELRRQGINPNWHKETMGEETGDFRAVLLSKDNSKTPRFEIEGEAAINYRRAQIEAKPDGMVWFVTSNVQKEMVIATKKNNLQAVWILENVCAPLAPQMPKVRTVKRKSAGENRNNLESKLHNYLRMRNEIYTGRALACILKEDLGNVSRVLQRLTGSGKIIAEEAKLTPARLRGRPNKLFWHVKNHEEINHSRAARIKAIVVSEVISFFSEGNYIFKGYSDSSRRAEFLPRDATKFAPVS
ncbi:MAG: hypothetical protein M3033_18345, partial [Acidobacteriota bacterium]|nr:hypothetical protein [Acidobacteriota bacterium]